MKEGLVIEGPGKDPFLPTRFENHFSSFSSVPPLSPPLSPNFGINYSSRCFKSPKNPGTPRTPYLGIRPEVMAIDQPSGNRGKRLTILSLDGGGVRGIIPATILEELEGYLQVQSHTRSLRIQGVFPAHRVFENSPVLVQVHIVESILMKSRIVRLESNFLCRASRFEKFCLWVVTSHLDIWLESLRHTACCRSTIWVWVAMIESSDRTTF